MILTMKLLHPLSSFTTLPPKTRQSKLYLVGQSEKGNVLKGLDLGVEGMRRLVIVPPELAYGKKGVQEIPPNATIEETKLCC
ncbi:unnamed protein product [Brassica rapa subsp. trilocularis]